MAANETTTEDHVSGPGDDVAPDTRPGAGHTTLPSLKDIDYGASAFYAIVKPVFVTMLLSALAVIYVDTPENAAATEQALSNSYNVRHSSPDDSNSQKFGVSLLNALVWVICICALTFVIVLLYKYRCMLFLYGYMIVASTMLLGFMSSLMLEVFCERYHINMDVVTFWWLEWNFALVGTASIFFGKGIPMYITQSYLILTSVIVAWQLSHFEWWSAWILLVLLALYDLLAVLTPCGPLKALVNLMSREDAPEMPGLLYQANVAGHQRQARQQRPPPPPSQRRAENAMATHQVRSPPDRQSTVETAQDTVHDDSAPSSSSSSETAGTATEVTNLPISEAGTASESESTDRMPSNGDVEIDISLATCRPLEAAYGTSPQAINLTRAGNSLPGDEEKKDDTGGGDARELLYAESSVQPRAPLSASVDALTAVNGSTSTVTGRIPLALAKLYKLPLADNALPSWRRPPIVDVDTGESIPREPEHFTAERLQSMVDAVFPRNGGRIAVHTVQQDGEATRYAVLDRHGEIKRILFVHPDDGRVFVDMREENARNGGDRDADERVRSTIRLGLGDFIFYSVLVSKAALYSFTSFCACTLVILCGLGLTLLLLAVRGQALPALPISIFLGVGAFALTYYAMEPYFQEVFIQGFYV